MIVFLFTLSGLRDSSVHSLPDRIASCTQQEISLRVSYWKVLTAEREPPIVYHRISEDSPSPLDLLCHWMTFHSGHRWFFGLSSSIPGFREGSPDRALQRCLQAIQHSAAPGCRYDAHSLHIGAHTTQVLMGMPLEVRMVHFGW